MKICILAHVFPARPGDIPGIFVRELARNLAARGHAVHVVTPRVEGAPDGESADGIHVHRFRHRGRFPSRLGALKRIPWGTFASFLASWTRETVRVVRAHEIDILHAYWVAPAGFVGVLAGLATGRPTVATAAGSDINVLPESPPYRPVIRWTLSRLDGLIALGSAMRARTVMLGMSGNRTHMIPEDAGIDPAFRVASRPSVDRVRLLFVGRLAAPKRLDTVIAAMPAILARRPDARLRIVGDGEDRPSLEARVRGLGIGHAVEFAGACAHEDLPRHFAEGDLFVYPTENEGLPTAIAEAMTSGLPVIASPVGGIPDQIRNGITGLWAPFDDPDAWSAAILRLIGNPAERTRLGANAQAFAGREFSTDRIAERVEAAYRAAFERSTSARRT